MANKVSTFLEEDRSQYGVSESAAIVAADSHRSTVTVLQSQSTPLTKRFYLDTFGVVLKEDYQLAKTFQAESISVGSITDLSRLLTKLSRHPDAAVVRGIPARPGRNIWRVQGELQEHPDGTSWVMLDIDGEAVPADMSPISVEAIKWFAQKLPDPFREATCHYQFSGSAGILDAAGHFLKPGLRVHLFYFLARPIKGVQLASYLKRFCQDTMQFEISTGSSGAASFKYMIDPAPIRTANQLHYTAAPIIDIGVNCLIDLDSRNGLLVGHSDAVALPDIDDQHARETSRRHAHLLNSWKVKNGYKRKVSSVCTNGGVQFQPYYRLPGTDAGSKRGYTLKGTNEALDGVCRLFFEEEGSPGSWRVFKANPLMARRYGDEETMALKELSEDAYAHVRDKLKWFQEIPYRSLALSEGGYVPAFDSFITSKYSLVLAPTGSGKTHAVIEWIRNKAATGVVIYVAQTIPLVSQMNHDLLASGVECFHYQDYNYAQAPTKGTFVTTNESLPRILQCMERSGLTPYHLVIDEFHVALDDFCKSNIKFIQFKDAVTRARSAIFMTGTITDIQRLMITGIVAKLGGEQLVEARYCCYEFLPVKRNPLRICELDDFRADVVELFKRLKADLDEGRPLPKVMLAISSSKMETYSILLRDFGLEDQCYVVSRQEALQDEIEEARIGAKPILIASPIFSIGLNFVRQLEVLYCRFDHVAADTSRIIQTINRANRGEVACEVRLYAGLVRTVPFYFPPRPQVIEQVRGVLAGEYSGAYNGADLPQILDLAAYKTYREVESNPNQAIGQLIRDDSFQNYAVVDRPVVATESTPPPRARKEAIQQFQRARKVAADYYDARILAQMPGLVHDVADVHFWRLKSLAEEKKQGYKQEEQRTPREIADEEHAILANLCGLDHAAKARKLNLRKLQSLFGDREPWLSDQFMPSTCSTWAQVAAEKTIKLLPVLLVLKQMQTGAIDGVGFATKLNRDKALQAGLKALVTSAGELVKLTGQLEMLATLRENARVSGSKENKVAAVSFALGLTKEILEPIGIFFPVVGTGREKSTDFLNPEVPANWNFDEMLLRLQRRKVLLESLPLGVDRVGRSLIGRGLYSSPISQCRRCKFFDAQCCALERHVDWGEEGFELAVDAPIPCEDFDRMPARLISV